MRAIMTFSAEVRRSKKTVSRVAAKCVVHVRQRKTRRLPLWVSEGAIALTLPCGIRLDEGTRDWDTVGPHLWVSA